MLKIIVSFTMPGKTCSQYVNFTDEDNKKKMLNFISISTVQAVD